MSKSEVFTKLQLIIQELLSLEDTSLITSQSSLIEDLAIDSLAMMDFVVALEENFPIRIPQDFEPETIKTVEDTADLVLRLMKK